MWAIVMHQLLVNFHQNIQILMTLKKQFDNSVDKMLEIIIFSFPLNVVYPPTGKFKFLSDYSFSYLQIISIWTKMKLSSAKGLTLFQMIKFYPYQNWTHLHTKKVNVTQNIELILPFTV